MGVAEHFGIIETAVGNEPREHGFYCPKLAVYILEEADEAGIDRGELWEQRFDEARYGTCSYRNKCPVYAKTLKKGIQQNLFNQQL